MKAIALQITGFSQKDIARLEKEGKIDFVIEGEPVEILLSDVEIFAEDIPGWVVSNQGALTVALDITITDELKMEGYARELVNRIQNYRKDSRLDVVDNISIEIESHPELDASFILFENFIKTETLCTDFSISQIISDPSKTKFEISEGIEIDVVIRKI
jgi:isoleucyl-tRNA synthetase